MRANGPSQSNTFPLELAADGKTKHQLCLRNRIIIRRDEKTEGGAG